MKHRMMGFFVEGTVASCYPPLLAGEVKHRKSSEDKGMGVGVGEAQTF